MLDDVEVGRLLPEFGMDLRAPRIQLENAVLARVREDGRVGRAVPIVGRKADAHEAYAKRGRPGLIERSTRVLYDPSRSHLLTVRGFAVRSILVNQVVFHVVHEISAANDRDVLSIENAFCIIARFAYKCGVSLKRSPRDFPGRRAA